MTTATFTITDPGVYPDLPEDAYHRDPVPVGSLSSGGARKLLPPSCPARYAYEREHPIGTTKTFDFGHAAHREILGVGADLAVVDAPDWRTKNAREARDTAHELGQTPLLTHEYDQVLAMAAALRAHPVAGALLQAEGDAEQSLFWIDQATGVWRRARHDKVARINERFLITDYKTTAAADLDAVTRSVHRYGYYLQAAWYVDAAVTLGLHDNPAFLFIFQEKDPPYLVTVAQLDDEAIAAGRRRARRALQIYAECVESGVWPAYSDEVELINLPAYALNQEF